MDGFIEAVATEGFAEGSMRVVTLDDHELLIARVGDSYYATDNRCPHMGGRLADGALEGTLITCPRHHSQFDVTDGRVVHWTDWRGAILKMAELVRHPRALRTYAVKVEDGKVMVGPENPPPAATG